MLHPWHHDAVVDSQEKTTLLYLISHIILFSYIVSALMILLTSLLVFLEAADDQTFSILN